MAKMPVPSKTARQNRDGAEKRKTATKTLRADILKRQKRIVSMNLKLDFLKLRTIFSCLSVQTGTQKQEVSGTKRLRPCFAKPDIVPEPVFYVRLCLY